MTTITLSGCTTTTLTSQACLPRIGREIDIPEPDPDWPTIALPDCGIALETECVRPGRYRVTGARYGAYRSGAGFESYYVDVDVVRAA